MVFRLNQKHDFIDPLINTRGKNRTGHPYMRFVARRGKRTRKSTTSDSINYL